jgi:hypothetical protein
MNNWQVRSPCLENIVLGFIECRDLTQANHIMGGTAAQIVGLAARDLKRCIPSTRTHLPTRLVQASTVPYFPATSLKADFGCWRYE